MRFPVCCAERSACNPRINQQAITEGTTAGVDSMLDMCRFRAAARRLTRPNGTGTTERSDAPLMEPFLLDETIRTLPA
jgi:hypothetical protein